MGVTTTKTNKPLNPRGNDQSPLAFNRAKLYSGKALDFDGVNDNIAFTEFEFTAGNKYSLCIYANRDANGMIWSRDNQWMEISFASGALQLRTYDTGWNTYTLIDDVPANEWHQIIVTYDVDANTWGSYLNGQFVKTITAAESDNKKINRIGSTIGQWYDGEFSNAKIFEVELTAAQVADLYNNPEKVVPTGVDNTALKLWLPMMEGAGTTAYDGSGNGNHGTISGATYVNGIGAPSPQSAVMDWNKGTNRLLYSNKFNEATWQKLAGSSVSATRVDGPYSEQAWSVTYDGTTNGRIEQVVSGITTGVSYTCKVWAKTTSGSVLAKLGGAGGTTSHTLTTEWQLIDDVKTATSTTGYPRLICDSAATIEVFGFSFRLTSEADLYIPTLATAQTSPVLLPQGLTTGRDITGVNLFENVRKQGALNLDGNSWAEVHDNASVDVGSFTLECWARFDKKTGTYQNFFSKGDSGSDRSFEMYLNTTETEFATNVFGTTVSWNTTTINTNQWYHVVCSFVDSTNEFNTYVDGSLNKSTSVSETQNNTDAPIIIGAWISKASSFVNGEIAQPRIYNRALTAEEVQRSYDSGKNIYTNS